MFWRILSRFLLWKSTALSPVKVRFNFRVSVCGVSYPQLDEIEGMTPPSYFPFSRNICIVRTDWHGRIKDCTRLGLRPQKP